MQKVVGFAHMSMMDGFSRYNQVDIHREDKKKNYFTTPWGTFIYVRIHFSLINAEATFQRAMYITFMGEYKFVEIYLDEITILIKIDEENIEHI